MANVRTHACLIVDTYLNIELLLKVVFKTLYPNDYTADVSTRVSNSLLVGKNHLFLFHHFPSKNHAGAIIGQVTVGLICDRIGRKAALVITTALIVLGATLATAAHGAGGSAAGLFWFLTVARQIIYSLFGCKPCNLLMNQTGGLQVL